MALEGILVNGVTEILKSLLPVIAQQISQACGVEDDLKKLGKTLESIQALISDAEEKQITDPTVRLWLRRLKDVVYDADDVMDEFRHETMRRRERESQLKHKVRDFISKSSNPLVFNKKMAGEIRAIQKRLDEIYKDRVRYSLNATTVGSTTSQVDLTREQRDRLTTSVANYSDLLGREGASSEVVKMLTNKTLPTSVSPSSSSSHNNSSLPVVSIVGMGGLGKTSLAQLVYKDESINKHFKQKIWVCISDNFDVSRILKEILESLTNGSCGNISNIDVLATKVRKELIGKNYLLVLDDLWSEDAGDWEKLQGVLVNGVDGSKILVTTRSQKVASVIRSNVYNLQKLTDDACWSIMQMKISSPIPQNMINIGRDIAKKCDGLPLAANFLGSLLHLKREESYWVSINQDKNMWIQTANTKVISILKLSYDNLPSPLKQCFSYCCLFPKDREIERKKLIWLWIAEGFIQSSEVTNYRSLEDIGNDYFEYLLFNSFFQDIKQDKLGDIFSCKMHDLVHDLAMSVVDRNEFGIDGKEDVSKVRRLQLICDSGASTSTAEVLREAKKLRTIVALDPENCLQISTLLPTNHLRVLYPLRSGYRFEVISLTSIPKFKHLRLLDLSYREFDLSHEVSINHSHNLQTLILRGCKNVSGILGGLVHLKQLRHLDVSWSDIKGLPDDSIANLTDLQTLDLQGCRQFEALPENIGLLKHLSHLDLSHSSIRKIPDSIANLTNLQTLDLYYCKEFEALPENIGSLKHLSHLDLSSSPIRKIPDSITCISSLVTLKFHSCGKLDALPTELGSLARLRCLDLSRTKIKVLPESCITSLCNLEIVDFGWDCELPKEIKNWPKLRVFQHQRNHDIMPRGMEKLTCLETLDYYMVREDIDQVYGSGIEELAALNSLQVLHIKNLENVRGGREDAERAKLMDKKDLRELVLEWGHWYDGKDAMVLEGLRPHPNLRKMGIFQFKGLNLPKWMGSSSNLLNLVELKLWHCNRCEKLPALGGLPCLRDLKIHAMDSVKCLGNEFYYQQQEEVETSSSTQNSTSSTSSLFPSLVNLEISLMDNLEEWVSPSPSSSYICVDSFPLLERLYIQECPKLTSLPDLRLWTSLRELFIFKCDKLKESMPYDLKTSLSFLDSLRVDFIQREDPQLPDPKCVEYHYSLVNLMERKKM